MAIIASELVAVVRAAGVAETQAALASVSTAEERAAIRAQAAQERFQMLGAMAAGALAVGLVVAAGKMVQMAGNFQSATEQLVTGAGEQQSALNGVRQGLLKMAVDTGTSTDQLAKGMFMVESAGYHGANGLQVLQVAAQGAKLENSDLGQTAFALTGLLHDYGMSSNQAADAMNALIATEASGKMHLADLTSSLGRVLPLAASLHVSFGQIGGAMATMTNANMTARNAANNLANTLRALAAPSGIAQKAMESVGLSAQQVHDALSHAGLAAAIDDVAEAIGNKFPANSVKAVEAFKAIMGGATGYNTALMLTGGHLAEFLHNAQHIDTVMHGGAKSIEGWSAVQGNFNFKVDQAKEALETTGIKIGTLLLPALSQVLDKLVPLITGFGNFAAMLLSHKEVLAAFAGILATLLVPALIAVTTAAWGFAAAILANPITWIALAIGAAVAGIILAIQHWGQITAWLSEQWNRFKSWIGGFFSALGSDFHNFWDGILNFVKGALSLLVDIWTAPFRAIGALFSWLYDHNTYFKALVDFVLSALGNLKTGIEAGLTWIKNFVGGVFSAIGTFVHEKIDFVKAVIGAGLSWIQSTFGSAFSAIGTEVHSAITGIWNWLITFANGWPKQALEWGINLIQGFITGIKSMFGNVMSTAGSLIHNVAAFMGFHSPAAMGEGAEADRWAPNLVHMFAQGLTQGLPEIQRAVNSLIKPVAVTMSAGGLPSGAFSTVHPLSGPYGQAPVYVEVYLDGSRMTKKIMPEIVRQIRVATGVRQ